MRKEDTLNKKLKAYSIVAAAVLAASGAAEAQIVYTDTTGIYEENQTGFNFDLNHDGAADFTFFLLRYNTGSQVNNQVLGFGSNSVYEVAGEVNSSNGYPYVSLINAGERIGDNLPWQPYASYFWVLARHIENGSSAVDAGNWAGAEDKYLGLRISVGYDSYYGWLRLSVDSNAEQFSVSGFAYQSIPDSAILAGDSASITSVSAIEVDNQISIFSAANSVFISNSFAGQSDMEVFLFDMAGRVIYNRRHATKTALIELPEAAPGIYLVKVSTGMGTATKKISIR